MALYYNNANIAPSANVFINNKASKQVLYNNAMVWKREQILFSPSSFGGLSTPTMGWSEGYSFRINTISGNWLINCDGRCDWWFPISTSGFSTVNITVQSREGAGSCYFFADASTNKWGVNAAYVKECTTVGTYAIGIPSSPLYIGVEALKGGLWISRMWLA